MEKTLIIADGFDKRGERKVNDPLPPRFLPRREKPKQESLGIRKLGYQRKVETYNVSKTLI